MPKLTAEYNGCLQSGIQASREILSVKHLAVLSIDFWPMALAFAIKWKFNGTNGGSNDGWPLGLKQEITAVKVDTSMASYVLVFVI